MSTLSSVRTQTPYVTTTIAEQHTVRPLCWGAVLAGAVAALSAHLLFTLFGIGLGLQMIDPLTETEPGQKFSIGVGIAWSVSALLALWIGGYVAGRLTPEPNRRLGAWHGTLVWSVATVVTLLSLTTGAGMLAGGVAKLTGRTIATAGAVATGAGAAAGGDLVSDFARQNGDLLGSFVREVVPQAGAQGGTANANVAPGAQREISWALLRFFSQDQAARTGETRQALVRAVAQNAGLSEADAQRRVDGWISSYDQIQRDLSALGDRAEARAREAADAASNYVTHAAVWTFVAFLIGAISASWGGASGAKARRENDADVAPATA